MALITAYESEDRLSLRSCCGVVSMLSGHITFQFRKNEAGAFGHSRANAPVPVTLTIGNDSGTTMVTPVVINTQ